MHVYLYIPVYIYYIHMYIFPYWLFLMIVTQAAYLEFPSVLSDVEWKRDGEKSALQNGVGWSNCNAIATQYKWLPALEMGIISTHWDTSQLHLYWYPKPHLWQTFSFVENDAPLCTILEFLLQHVYLTYILCFCQFSKTPNTHGSKVMLGDRRFVSWALILIQLYPHIYRERHTYIYIYIGIYTYKYIYIYVY